jgi:hypothetical protein
MQLKGRNLLTLLVRRNQKERRHSHHRLWMVDRRREDELMKKMGHEWTLSKRDNSRGYFSFSGRKYFVRVAA